MRKASAGQDKSDVWARTGLMARIPELPKAEHAIVNLVPLCNALKHEIERKPLEGYHFADEGLAAHHCHDTQYVLAELVFRHSRQS